MNRLFIIMAVIIITAVIIGGCARAVPQTTIIRVPVPVFCDTPDLPAPGLPLDDLALDASQFEKVRALIASLEVQDGYIQQLRVAIDSCKSK